MNPATMRNLVSENFLAARKLLLASTRYWSSPGGHFGERSAT